MHCYRLKSIGLTLQNNTLYPRDTPRCSVNILAGIVLSEPTRYNVDYVKSKVGTWHFQCWRKHIGRAMHVDSVDISTAWTKREGGRVESIKHP